MAYVRFTEKYRWLLDGVRNHPYIAPGYEITHADYNYDRDYGITLSAFIEGKDRVELYRQRVMVVSFGCDVCELLKSAGYSEGYFIDLIARNLTRELRAMK